MNRFAFFTALLTILPVALAQTYPACATTCLYDTATISQAGCLASDGYCLCTSQFYLKSTTCCIRSHCGASDQKDAFAQAVYACSTWGVTLNTDASVTCSATTTTSNPTQAANTATVASSTAAPLTNTNPKYHPKKGLSAGAKGGIGGGVGIVVLALGALAGFLLKRRNDKKKAAATVPAAAAAQFATAPSAPAGYSEKDGASVAMNQAPPFNQAPPQYPQTPQGQYVQPQQQQQYQPPPFQPYAPQPSQTPQPQYAPQPSQTPQPQYAPQPSQTPQPQYQYPAQQNQAPAYNTGTELQGSPIVQNQPQQAWNSAELPAPGTVQPRHEAP
ncbi:hypothetical protein AOQ84DRAFT_225579 [Glonium stellatum]|uniref:CFEM domain-containing protein n=1 Tax=Glonium stellatum TaxID=574774 RepID=A0A8E2EUA2_9PEZI|nr:hypothetical protein AOQ84DRAFT_225579 [Glonium stellatum]